MSIRAPKIVKRRRSVFRDNIKWQLKQIDQSLAWIPHSAVEKCVDSPLNALCDKPEEEQTHTHTHTQPAKPQLDVLSDLSRVLITQPFAAPGTRTVRRWSGARSRFLFVSEGEPPPPPPPPPQLPRPRLHRLRQARKAENQFPHTQNKSLLLPVSVRL